MNSSEAQAVVLAEYRRRRHAHRPYEAMRAIANGYASSYCYGALVGLLPDAATQLHDLDRFQVADDYTKVIAGHWRKATDARCNYWLVGHGSKPVSS